jgi:hypothetical protein
MFWLAWNVLDFGHAVGLPELGFWAIVLATTFLLIGWFGKRSPASSSWSTRPGLRAAEPKRTGPSRPSATSSPSRCSPCSRRVRTRMGTRPAAAKRTDSRLRSVAATRIRGARPKPVSDTGFRQGDIRAESVASDPRRGNRRLRSELVPNGSLTAPAPLVVNKTVTCVDRGHISPTYGLELAPPSSAWRSGARSSAEGGAAPAEPAATRAGPGETATDAASVHITSPASSPGGMLPTLHRGVMTRPGQAGLG